MRKCYYSGVEGKQHYNACIDAGVKNVLASFLYLENNDPDLIRHRKLANPEVSFMIDSGAHTIMSDKAKYGAWALQDFEAYIKRYIKWLRSNRDFIECAVELDIDWVVGKPVVEGWQKKFFIPLVEEGFNIIFVWHKERGQEGWENMSSQFAYIGLPGELSSEPDFNKYMAVARRYNTKVHGFAATKQSDFRDWPWYTADSTTWKSSERYGTLIHWDEHAQKLIFEEDKTKRVLYRRYFEKYNLDADGIIQDKNYKEVTKYALISMRRMEDFYAERNKERVFFYDLRLPHPKAVMNLSLTDVPALWKMMRPEVLFKAHVNETNLRRVRSFLAAIAAVQYKSDAWLLGSPDALKFLGAYFPKLVSPQLADMQVFQKELSAFIAPPNPPPLQRMDAEQYTPTNNPPKRRDEKDLELADLEPDLVLNFFKPEDL
jgi:hypothetical protein